MTDSCASAKFVCWFFINSASIKSNLSLYLLYYVKVGRVGGAHLCIIAPVGNTAPFEEMRKQ